MEEVLRRLREEGHYTARVDLMRVATKVELAKAIADACFENITKTARALRAIREWATGRSPELKFKAGTSPDAEVAISFAVKANEKKETELLDDALALPQEMAERANRRFFLVYDEFQEIAKLNSGILGRIAAYPL